MDSIYTPCRLSLRLLRFYSILFWLVCAFQKVYLFYTILSNSFFFFQFKCCGVDGYENYLNASDDKKFPKTCCKNEKVCPGTVGDVKKLNGTKLDDEIYTKVRNISISGRVCVCKNCLSYINLNSCLFFFLPYLIPYLTAHHSNIVNCVQTFIHDRN